MLPTIDRPELMEEDASGTGGFTEDATAELFTCGAISAASDDGSNSIISPTFLLDLSNILLPLRLNLLMEDELLSAGTPSTLSLLKASPHSTLSEMCPTASFIFARLSAHDKIKMVLPDVRFWG